MLERKTFLQIAISILIFSMLLPNFAHCADIENINKNSSKVKSLIFPGWGQIAEGDWLKGIFFAGAETACIIYIVDNGSRGSDYYTLYKEAATIEDAVYYRQLTEKYDKRRNIGVMAAIGIWALNILDMALFGDEENPASKNEDKNIMSRIYIQPTEHGGFCVGFRIAF